MSRDHAFTPPSEFLFRANEELKMRSFVPLDPEGGDRHGTWEATWIHNAGRRWEWVSLAMLALPEDLRIEVWVGAEDDARAARMMLVGLNLQGEEGRAHQADPKVWFGILGALIDGTTQVRTVPMIEGPSKHLGLAAYRGKDDPSVPRSVRD